MMHFAKNLNFATHRKSVEKNVLSKRKIGVIERPRSLNPGKAIEMVICSFVVHFITNAGIDA